MGQKKAIGGGSRTELRMALVQIHVALDDTNGVNKFSGCVLPPTWLICHIEVMKLEVNHNLIALCSGSSQLSSENDVNTEYEVE